MPKKFVNRPKMGPKKSANRPKGGSEKVRLSSQNVQKFKPKTSLSSKPRRMPFVVASAKVLGIETRQNALETRDDVTRWMTTRPPTTKMSDAEMSDEALQKSGSDWKSDSLLLTWNRGSLVPVNAKLSLSFNQ